MRKDLPITVADIVSRYLITHGYNGLCREDCGCALGDLSPCECNQMDCIPAYNHPRIAKREECTIWMTPKKRGGK